MGLFQNFTTKIRNVFSGGAASPAAKPSASTRPVVTAPARHAFPLRAVRVQ